MSLGKVLTITFWIVVIASFPAIVWFFRIRRVMIRKQVIIIRTLENSLKPRDKRYWLLGYLVGFRAKYWINRGGVKRAWALYITPPHHVFFYIPVIILLKKRERLEITLELDKSYKLGGEAHLYDPREKFVVKTLRRELKTFQGFKNISFNLDNENEYKVLYRGQTSAFENIKSLFNLLVSKYKVKIYRISLDSSKNVIHISFNPNSQEEISKTISTLLDFVKNLRVRT